MQTLIDSSRTVAEILLEDPARAIVFEKHRIDYCCNGKKPLAEACSRRGVDVNQLLAELAEAHNQPSGDCAEAKGLGCAKLVDHIVTHHHALLRRELPRLSMLAAKVAVAHGDHEPRCREVAKVYEVMRTELLEHMEKEEQVLFPYVVGLEQGRDSRFPTIGMPISCMEHEHAEVGVALERLRELTSGFTPPADACNSWRVLYHGLGELERDLHQHIHEENNILFPRALAMEAAVRAAAGVQSAS